MDIIKNKGRSKRKGKQVKDVKFYKKIALKRQERKKLDSCNCTRLPKMNKHIDKTPLTLKQPRAVDNGSQFGRGIEQDIKPRVVSPLSVEAATLDKLNKKIKMLQAAPQQIQTLQNTVKQMQTQIQQLGQYVVKLKTRVDTYEYSYRYDLEVGDR